MADIASYRSLFAKFVDEELSPEAFQRLFLEMFKSETRQLPEELFFILDRAFADADCFTSNAELVRARPQMFIDEQELRRRIFDVLARLERWNSE